jgi:hypothetical protein
MRSLLLRSATTVAMAALIGLLAPSLTVQQYSVPQPAAMGLPGVAAFTHGAATSLRSTLDQDGRWKLGGDGSCYFDPEDSGDDQCSPTLGRWKLGGDGSCNWDPDDSGPNQCTPPAADPGVTRDATGTVSAQLRSAELRSRL